MTFTRMQYSFCFCLMHPPLRPLPGRIKLNAVHVAACQTGGTACLVGSWPLTMQGVAHPTLCPGGAQLLGTHVRCKAAVLSPSSQVSPRGAPLFGPPTHPPSFSPNSTNTTHHRPTVPLLIDFLVAPVF